jgi:hypothetical protein
LSTKRTIKASKYYHLYEELFDENNVYLEIDNPDSYSVDSYMKANGIVIVTVSINKSDALDLGLI